ncbi:MAG: 4Fe-4S dicluster domain-containing protein [Acidobacteriota bacterium]
MAELRPVPLATLLRRAYYEYVRCQAIFDLPARSFYRTPRFDAFRNRADAGRAWCDGVTESVPEPRSPNPDLSVSYAGARAPNPIGPAAGPHTQLAQNIVMSWLAGAGIIELKTVQLRDRLSLSRPCIDMKTVGFNTEWSQELRLEESLREYVKASMIVEMLAGIRDSGSGIRNDTLPVFDISVGYDLAGITSPAVVRWLTQMRDAAAVVDELRAEIPDEFARLRHLPYRTALSRSVTLSTFHGAPVSEIERICEFLIGEMGFHTIVKLNPPMLGRDRLEHILHEALGYDDVEVNPEVYERELAFDEGVHLVRRLHDLAARHGLVAGVKCGNTLEVRNTGAYLKEPVQYLSGQPLHALHVALVQRWREAFGTEVLVSFAGGVDAHNAADCVAAGLVPVTTCTDLLRPGGYARLPKYLQSLASRMKQVGAATIEEFIVTSARGPDEADFPGPDPRTAIARNTQRLLDRALGHERYRAARNRKPPRKLGTRLWLWDCLSCRKCIPVCPNDGIFEIETESFVGHVPVVEVTADGWRAREWRIYRALKTTQIVIFADACNDCGNCDVFCPEDGGPNLEKPRFFGSLEAYQQAAPLTGFVLTMKPRAVFDSAQVEEAPGLRSSREGLGPRLELRGRFADGEHMLEHEPGSTTALLHAPGARVTVDWATHEVREAVPDWDGHLRSLATASSAKSGIPNPESRIPNPVLVDLSPYLTLRLLAGGLMNRDRVNFVNAPFAAVQ